MKIFEVRRISLIAQDRLQLLNKKYPKMRAALMLGNGFGEVPIFFEESQLLDRASSMFVNSAAFKECSVIWSNMKRLEESNSYANSDFVRNLCSLMRDRVGNLVKELEIDERSYYSLRFDELDAELINQLQADPLIDRTLTPKGGASIKVVIGSLGNLKRCVN